MPQEKVDITTQYTAAQVAEGKRSPDQPTRERYQSICKVMLATFAARHAAGTLTDAELEEARILGATVVKRPAWLKARP